MPLGGGGTWDRTPGTRIANQGPLVSAQVNDETDNLLAGINIKASLSGALGMTGLQTLFGAGTAALHGATVGQVQSGAVQVASAVGGTVDAITITMAPATTAWVSKERFVWISGGANTVTAPTINKDGLGTKTVKSRTGAALAVGDLGVSGTINEGFYNGTDVLWLGTASVSGAAQIGSANTFTATPQTVTSTDAGATELPQFVLDRNSASPVAADILGGFLFQGRSSTAVTRVYARIRAVIKTATNAAEDGLFAIRTMLAGTEADRIIVGAGLYTAGATGGDKGADTINAGTLYQNGVAVTSGGSWTSIFKATAQTKNSNAVLAADTDLQFTAVANKVYSIRGRIFFTSHSTPDFQFSVTGPVATGIAISKWIDSAVYGFTPEFPTASATYVAANSLLGGSTHHSFIELDIAVTVGGSGGTIAFNWAQDTSNANPTTVEAGSWLEYKQVN